MIITTKVMIGVFSFWVLAQIICNWFDGQANILTATDMANMNQLQQSSTVTSTQTTGETSNPLQWVSAAKDTILKLIEFKYSFWYDIQPGYDATSCSAAGGEWHNTTSLCWFTGPWEIVHAAFLRPIGWAILLTFVAIGIGKLFGG